MVDKEIRVTGVLKFLDKDNSQEQSIEIDGIVTEFMQMISPQYLYAPSCTELHIILNSWKILNNDTTELDDSVKNYCSNFCVFAKNGCPKECPLLVNKIP